MSIFKSGASETPKNIIESIPEETYYWAAMISILLSLSVKMAGRDHLALFIGQWPPTFLLFGLYRRLSK